ncbi:hypothetical protein AMTRI_Chr03g144850 [Amborella trichopoda]
MSSCRVRRLALKVLVKALWSSMSSPIRASQTPQSPSTFSSKAPNQSSKIVGFYPNLPSRTPWLSCSNCISRCATRSCNSAIPPAMVAPCQP